MNNTNSKDIGISNSCSNGRSDIAIDKNGDLGEKKCEPKIEKIKEVKPKKKECVSLNKAKIFPSVECWTRNRLIDELVNHLSSVNSYVIDKFTKQIVFSHKYQDQADWIIYRINIWRPIPHFTINKSDLPAELRKKLADTCPGPADLDKVLTETVRRILEAVNPRYFHLSGIYGKVRWRLES